MVWRRKFSLSEFWRLWQNVGPVFVLEDLRWDGDRRSKKQRMKEKAQKGINIEIHSPVSQQKILQWSMLALVKLGPNLKSSLLQIWVLFSDITKFLNRYITTTLLWALNTFCSNFWGMVSCVQATVLVWYLYFITTAWFCTDTSEIRWVCAPRDKLWQRSHSYAWAPVLSPCNECL